ncbi:MAG: phage tail terminator-like protein [Dehalococcoidia bacterium]
MSLTFSEARDQIQTLFNVPWLADTPAITGTAPPVEWDNLEPLVPSAAPWARANVAHEGGGQDSLSGGLGTSRFLRTGTFTVSIYTVLGTGTVISDALAKVVMDTMEGNTTADGLVWFRNIQLNEVGPDPDKDPLWYKVDVIAEFEYDEIK